MEEKLIALCEKQINKELWSGYLYLNVAEFYRKKGLDGFHAWFMNHAKEELEHAEKFCEFLQDRDVEFKLLSIDAPKEKFKDLKDPLLFQVEHEKKVTNMIKDIYAEATKENDYLAKNFLEWFLGEQFEEETTAKNILDNFTLFASDGSGLYKVNELLKNEANRK